MKSNDTLLTKSVSQVLPDKQSLEKLTSSKKIRVYQGVDPTGPQLHLGHSIGLSKLQEFADKGHEAFLIFGTGTVLAGDPSQRAQIRKKVTQKEIEENIKTWKLQAEKIINFEKVEVKYNGDWLLKLNLADIIDIASNLSATQLIKRDMFQERLKRGDTVWLHEVLYPMLQGYDSVAMDIDLEIGGTDQTFNMLIGRELQKKLKGREKFVLTVPLISGTDGKPMSKSSGNCIWLNDSAEEITKKIMSLPDKQLREYWENLTELPLNDLNNLDPLEAKKKLGLELVKKYHGKSATAKAIASSRLLKEYAAGKLSPQSLSSLPTVSIPNGGTTILELTTQFEPAGSVTHVKSLANQGAIDVNFKKTTDLSKVVRGNQIIRVGKKNIYKLEEK